MVLYLVWAARVVVATALQLRPLRALAVMAQQALEAAVLEVITQMPQAALAVQALSLFVTPAQFNISLVAQ
jgi:hypothetical protein